MDVLQSTSQVQSKIYEVGREALLFMSEDGIMKPQNEWTFFITLNDFDC